jgi:hypothetical protein
VAAMKYWIPEERLRNASNVESQEPCIHPSVSDTARARLVLRCSPVLSRHHREENRYKTRYKYRYEYGSFHVKAPTNIITSPWEITSAMAIISPTEQACSKLLSSCTPDWSPLLSEQQLMDPKILHELSHHQGQKA